MEPNPEQRTEHDPRYDLDAGQSDALYIRATAPGGLGEDRGLACNVDPGDHVHVNRVGEAGGRLDSRVTILTHSAAGAVGVILSAAQARRLASWILDAADEVDGASPLVFFPCSPGEEAVEEDVDEEAPSGLLTRLWRFIK